MDLKLTVVTYAIFVASAAAIYFFAKRGSATLPPLLLNGYRLTLAGLFLLLVSALCGAPIAVGLKTLAIYGTVAVLAIAVPQAMLFVALKRNDVSETLAAFIEGCIPGIAFVFLVAANPYANRLLSSICVLCALFGLMIFLGIRPSARGASLSKGTRMVLVSAGLTATGLVIASLLLPTAGFTVGDKLRQSIANTAWTAVLAGFGTLLHARFVAGLKLRLPDRQSVPYILALALVGTCIGWASLFVLLREDVLVAATADVAVPVAVAAASWLFYGKKMTGNQRVGAAVITASLVALIVIKLA